MEDDELIQVDHTFCQEALEMHNKHRARHGTEPLQLSDKFSRSAQGWAETLLDMPMLQNSQYANNGDVGENISMRRGSDTVDINGREVTDQWYNDINKYDFEKGQGEAGNFTQLIWVGTQEVGFGKARSPDGMRCIVVAHYYPPGNVIGHYISNVKPPLTDESYPKERPAHRDSPILPRGRSNARIDVKNERTTSPNGHEVFIRREVKEYIDSKGNVVRNTREVHFGTEKEAREYDQVHRDTSPSSVGSSSESDTESKPSETIDARRKRRELAKFRANVIRLHNHYRKLHGVGRVKRNPELHESAQKWADYLLSQPNLSNSNFMFKSMRVGENIASRRSNAPCDYSAEEVVEHWYLEHNKYSPDSEPQDVQGIGNFTQLVWKGSREIGIGKASKQDEETGATRVIVVCHYFPAGNVLTQFRENVKHRAK